MAKHQSGGIERCRSEYATTRPTSSHQHFTHYFQIDHNRSSSEHAPVPRALGERLLSSRFGHSDWPRRTHPPVQLSSGTSSNILQLPTPLHCLKMRPSKPGSSEIQSFYTRSQSISGRSFSVRDVRDTFHAFSDHEYENHTWSTTSNRTWATAPHPSQSLIVWSRNHRSRSTMTRISIRSCCSRSCSGRSRR